MICISLGNITFNECEELVRKEEFVELRLDLLRLTPGQVKELVALPGKKIVTCRKDEYDDNERLNLFSAAIEAGADFVDLELEMGDILKQAIIRQARLSDCRVIISHHDYEGTPGNETLRELIMNCREAGADIVKIACQVNKPSDNIRLLSMYEESGQKVIIGMGKLGIITRIAGPLLGGSFTFASPGENLETAKGQLTKNAIEEVYRLIGVEFNP